MPNTLTLALVVPKKQKPVETGLETGVQYRIATERAKGTFATDLPCFLIPKTQHLLRQPYPTCAWSATAIWSMLLRKQTHTKTCMSCGLVLILQCFEGKICRTLWFLPPLSKLCWSSGTSSLCCIFLGPLHVLPTAGWGMLEEGSTPMGWVLDQPGKVLVRHPCSCCLLVQRFLLCRFPLQHLYSQSFLQTVQSLIWSFDMAWIYTIHYTHKKMLQVFTAALLFTAHTQTWLSSKGSPAVFTACSKILPCSQD